MKFLLVLAFAFLSGSAFAQDYDQKPFFEIRIGYLPNVVNAKIKGESAPWINTLSSEGDNRNADQFASGNFGFTYGKYLSSRLRLGLGVDVDFYHNITEGRSYRAVPVFADFRYNSKETKSGLFAYAQAGYSFITGTDWQSGLKSGVGVGYSLVSPTGGGGLSFSVGYNYQILNKLPQQLLGPPTSGEGYYGPTTVRYLTFVGYKNVIMQTLPLKIAYEF